MVTCAGILVADFIAADLPGLPGPGEVAFAPKGVGMRIGGHSANVSIDLIKLGLRRGEVSSTGAVGEDSLGKFIEETLNVHGVITHLYKVEGVETAKSLLLVVKGEDRRVVVDVGANLRLNPDYVLSVLRAEKPLIFYVGAAGWLGDFDERLKEVLIEAKRLGSLTFVDPIAPYGRGWGFITEAAEWMDVFHCNAIEAAGITGRESVEEGVKELMAAGVTLSVVSLGGEGLMAGFEGKLFSMPAFKVRAVDPTGAGDAFCAGLIYRLARSKGEGLRKGLEIEEKELLNALLEGEAAGAACVTDVGTTTAVTRENVDSLLAAQGGKILKETRVLEEA